MVKHRTNQGQAWIQVNQISLLKGLIGIRCYIDTWPAVLARKFNLFSSQHGCIPLPFFVPHVRFFVPWLVGATVLWNVASN